MLRRQELIILAVAIICGAVAFVIISNILQKSAKLKQRYVVTVHAVSKHQIIGEKDVALSEPVENANSADLFLQAQDVVGNEALSDMAQGQLVKRSQVQRPVPVVVKSEPIKDIMLAVPSGKRAFTVASSEVEDLPGSLTAGSFVDILGNIKMSDGNAAHKTVIRGAQVIGVAYAGGGSSIKSVTVALSSVGTEMVASSLARGKLRFVVVADGTNAGVVQQDQGTIEIIRGVDKEVVNRNPQAHSK